MGQEELCNLNTAIRKKLLQVQQYLLYIQLYILHVRPHAKSCSSPQLEHAFSDYTFH